MKKYFFILGLLLLVSCTYDLIEGDVMNSDLNLISPNGECISSSMHELRKEIAEIVAESIEMDANIVIKRIDYLPVKEGFAATVSFVVNNEKEMKIAKTNIIPDNLLSVVQEKLSNDFRRISSRSENSASFSFEGGTTIYLTCKAEECDCTPEFKLTGDGGVSYSCINCEICTEEVRFEQK